MLITKQGRRYRFRTWEGASIVVVVVENLRQGVGGSDGRRPWAPPGCARSPGGVATVGAAVRAKHRPPQHRVSPICDYVVTRSRSHLGAPPP
ncbi:hypothetical protein GWI33_008647 [Rhynchophorus ferrugineus]|uniref:Uncharacterized protein n=1 Tax=Rhynchophorus ferrugineus TaxID=354439 RepID=A0A834IBS5_RHYFE|nr:hypothetical protein GWI33_008647 [Rhynchophorus ferrugineus]